MSMVHKALCYHTGWVTCKLLLKRAKTVHSPVIDQGDSRKINFLLPILDTSPVQWLLGMG